MAPFCKASTEAAASVGSASAADQDPRRLSFHKVPGGEQVDPTVAIHRISDASRWPAAVAGVLYQRRDYASALSENQWL